MKIIKIYHYSIRYILTFFGITGVRYCLGNKDIFTIERILFCIISGLFFGIVFLWIDTFNDKRRKSIIGNQINN